MDCKFVRENLIDIVEGRFKPEANVQLEIHLQSCGKCASLVDRFGRLWAVWGETAPAEPSPFFWTRLQQRLRASEVRRPWFTSFLAKPEHLLRPAIALASVLIGIVAGHYLGNFPAEKVAQLLGQRRDVATEQLVEYHLGPLDDFPSGSVADMYLNVAENN